MEVRRSQLEFHRRQIAILEAEMDDESGGPWEPAGGSWYINVMGSVSLLYSSPGSQRYGTERKTQIECQEAQVRYRKMHRLDTWLCENDNPSVDCKIEFEETSIAIVYYPTLDCITRLKDLIERRKVIL
jgi:hypothetical protein